MLKIYLFSTAEFVSVLTVSLPAFFKTKTALRILATVLSQLHAPRESGVADSYVCM